MSLRGRPAGALLLLLGAVLPAAAPSARGDTGPIPALFTFVPPHRLRDPAASLTASLEAAVDTRLAAAPVHSLADAVRIGLAITAEQLHFGLSHRTHLDFDLPPREGNCVEYAELFAAVFVRATRLAGLAASVHIVRSDARLFGLELVAPSLRDHDWVLISVPGGDPLYVDPTLAGAGLGWDIESRVAGDLPPTR